MHPPAHTLLRPPLLVTSGVLPPECIRERVDVRGWLGAGPARGVRGRVQLRTAAGVAVAVGTGSDGLPHFSLKGLEKGHEMGLQQMYASGNCADVEIRFGAHEAVPVLAVRCVAEHLTERCPQLLEMLRHPPLMSYIRAVGPDGGLMPQTTDDEQDDFAEPVMVRYAREFADPAVFEMLFRYATFGADCAAPPDRPVPGPAAAADVVVAARHFGIAELATLAEGWAVDGMRQPAVSDLPRAAGSASAVHMLIHLRTMRHRHPPGAVAAAEEVLGRLSDTAHAALRSGRLPRLPLPAPVAAHSDEERVARLEAAGLLSRTADLPDRHLLRLHSLGALSDAVVKAKIRRVLGPIQLRQG
eukprot:TRINITY_DN55087_c0_g1_i1.p1 TRINITY_DN55087_c0_g1~~TRINITY_DN55087_c0_g1_i1.p1  ORF type:complete len:357 (+),score=43.16 TRINITY_DN55087_c0_g1_i1:105-1175(+)